MKRLMLVAVLAMFAFACGSDSKKEEQKTEDNVQQGDGTTEDDTTPEEDTKPEEDKVGEDVPDPVDVKDDKGDEDVQDCLEICGDWVCGTKEGCECGTCLGANMLCTEGECICQPNCDGKDCGANGCGGVCGECTDGKVCDPDNSTCAVPGVCEPTFDAHVGKLNYLAIGVGGHAGEALDVDGDPTTCAPDGDCEDGLNNQLSGLLGQLEAFVNVQEELDKALAGGDVLLLAEMVEPKEDGTEFTLNMYLGKNVKPVEECDYQTAACEYYAGKDSFNAVSCKPIIFFENAVLNAGKLHAGGPDDLFSVSIPIQDGVVITVTANMAQVIGDVTLSPVAIDNGLIGGAVRKDKIMEAVDMLPADVVAELPVSIDMVKSMLDMFITPDVDTDGDDEPDGASIGIKFKAIAGTIVGMEPEVVE